MGIISEYDTSRIGSRGKTIDLRTLMRDVRMRDVRILPRDSDGKRIKPEGDRVNTQEHVECIVQAICQSAIDESMIDANQVHALTILPEQIVRAREILVMALARSIDEGFAAELKSRLNEIDNPDNPVPTRAAIPDSGGPLSGGY